MRALLTAAVKDTAATIKFQEPIPGAAAETAVIYPENASGRARIHVLHWTETGEVEVTTTNEAGFFPRGTSGTYKRSNKTAITNTIRRGLDALA